MLSIFHGDITKLKVECIVNASNESGLGCNIPNHCVDSAIHLASGPQLLEECKKLGGIPTSVAKITHAYKLPSKYIIHVTGPKKQNDGYEDYQMLKKCYIACLELANKNGIKELAFCCISTGLFGFDKKKSAIVAINTVINWLKTNKNNFQKIIFVVYTNEDNDIYRKILSS
jgi:O-acetyl-ADP-ribose deacetylase (regulator of RNase III)